MQSTAEMQQLIEDFSLFDDWEDKYAYLIELGATLPPLADAYKQDSYKVHGCTSQVWLVHQSEKDKHYFLGDSDAHIVKGLVAVLLRLYSGQTADTILSLDIRQCFNRLGLAEYLSPSRSNGFFAMVERVKHYAMQL